MKVILSGMNIDRERLTAYRERARMAKNILEARGTLGEEAIHALEEFSKARDLTPETLSAGYARISRDPRPVDEIRHEAVIEVDRARRSNETIIFEMGHSSVAEHAVFNLDIIGISRLAAEYLQQARLASYTEKSQRYITLSDDYLIPDEIKEMGLVGKFAETVAALNRAYHAIYEQIHSHLSKASPELLAEKKGKALLEGRAKEDARYVAPLATLTQMGMTVNSRVIEMTIRRLSANPLLEVQCLARAIHDAVFDAAPSLIRYTEPTPYDTQTRRGIAEAAGLDSTPGHDNADRLTLLDSPTDGDERIIAALLFSQTQRDFAWCKATAREMGDDQKKAVIDAAFAHMESYDRALREFELVSLTFQATVSASNFAQLKRHRMATIITQDYDPTLGVEIPPTVTEAGAIDSFTEAIRQAEAMSAIISKANHAAATYILTNAHRRRVIIHTNLRELYHISRLRMDSEAQWDIRDLTTRMVEEARRVFPHSGRLLGGKDAFSRLKGMPKTNT